jgi:hypothetical protein
MDGKALYVRNALDRDLLKKQALKAIEDQEKEKTHLADQIRRKEEKRISEQKAERERFKKEALQKQMEIDASNKKKMLIDAAEKENLRLEILKSEQIRTNNLETQNMATPVNNFDKSLILAMKEANAARLLQESEARKKGKLQQRLVNADISKERGRAKILDKAFAMGAPASMNQPGSMGANVQNAVKGTIEGNYGYASEPYGSGSGSQLGEQTAPGSNNGNNSLESVSVMDKIKENKTLIFAALGVVALGLMAYFFFKK